MHYSFQQVLKFLNTLFQHALQFSKHVEIFNMLFLQFSEHAENFQHAFLQFSEHAENFNMLFL